MKLLFIYNANSGLFSQLADAAHKLLSPNTYSCNLCKLTYGSITMKTRWKEYLESIHIEKEFLHKDEFLQRYPTSQIALPAVLTVEQEQAQELVTAHELNAIRSLDGLIALMKAKLSTHQLH